MRVTRRVKIGAGVVFGGLILALGAGVAMAARGGGPEDDDPAVAAAETGDGAGRRRTTTTVASTTTTIATPTTTAAVAPPATTVPPVPGRAAGAGSPPTTRPRAPAPPNTLPPLPAPTTTLWVDTRPEATDWSAGCQTTGPTTVVATARVVWSDGFVDEFSATVTTPGYNQNVGHGQRGWWIIVDVIPPPEGAIGNFACGNTQTVGVARWDG